MKKNILIVLFCIFSTYISSQTSPKNTRLFQINTLKGSELKILESTESHIYHVGTANSELGFEGYNYSSVGNDDLFILKSNSDDGSNVWLKTFNAGVEGKIYPKKIHTDANNNVYVFGEFSGSIVLGSKTITSNSTENTFLLKLDENGNGVWLNSFANTDAKFAFSIKMATDNTDLFMIYSQNHLVRMNNTTGTVVYNKNYSPLVDLRGVAVNDTHLFVAGYTLNATETFGTETVIGKNGFVLKGDKEANFISSVKTVSSSVNGANISDIAFDSAGQLLLTGYSNSSTNLESETGLVAYTYNPKTPIEPDKVYYYTAKIDADLATISYFRNSSPINRSGNRELTSVRFSSKLIPFGNLGQYKLLNNVDNFSAIKDFTNPNGNITFTGDNSQTSQLDYVLTSSDDLGISIFQTQSVTVGSLLTSSFNSYVISTIKSRLFTTEARNISNTSLMWTKQKTSSVGGAISTGFVHHLNSEKDDVFVSAVIEGKGNFFGKQVNNITDLKSNHFARLGIDGIPKWTARFIVEGGTSPLNYTNDFAAVDKDDNLIFLANTFGNSSTFYDATGQSVDFQQNSNQTSKALIKLDKNGNLLWSKKLTPNGGAFMASVNTDSNGDIHIIGETDGNLIEIGGVILGSTTNSYATFFLKLNGITGAVIYGKSYPTEGSYTMQQAIDEQNNVYAFIEPYDFDEENFTFGNIIIPKAVQGGNQLMLKLNSTGDVIFGKNFYAGNTTDFSSFIMDVKFDGQNFIISSLLTGTRGENFIGLDLQTIPFLYPHTDFQPLIAKVSTNGTVIWQKPFYKNANNLGNYDHIQVDQEKNIYIYQHLVDKLNYNNVEYSFDPIFGNKVIQKLDTNGVLLYNIVVDKFNSPINPMIDVFGVDQFNFLAATKENNILAYPINNNNSSNLYIATFGNLNKKYLTPTKNYLDLNVVNVSNNPTATDNQFYFDLNNNVNWSAISDQPWLNLSFTSLIGKNPLNTINGTGDAKITLTADANTTGGERTADITILGDEVAGKTIIVTQGATLATGGSKITVITLYPNPTSDYLNIKSDQKISQVEVFDRSGKMVRSSLLQNNQIDVSALIKGNYIIKISTENGVVTSKFIKK